MPQYPPIKLVNENDEPIGSATMDELHKNGWLHDVVVVIVKDEQGNMLLQKRGPNVATNPNMWDAAAAGHVDEGEDYLTAAKRELFEEIGVEAEDEDLVEAAYYRSDAIFGWRKVNRFRKVYITIVPADTEFKISQDEISEIKWLTPDELQDLIQNHPQEITEDFVDDLVKVQDENNGN